MSALEFVHERFSPMRFAEDHAPESASMDVILEAARCAPSAGNSQPWRFIVGHRGDPIHRRMVKHLARSSAAWAPGATFLVANLAHVRVEGSEMEYSEFALYDLGQAIAHMTFQAHALGMSAHQFRAFDKDATSREFSIPDQLTLVSMTAFGVADHTIDENVGSGTSRDRYALEEITWARASPASG